MFFRHALDKVIIAVVIGIILVVISYHPQYRLRSDMPPGFFKTSAGSEDSNHSLEERVAWGYWESALMDIQWKYSRVQPLPAEPPAEFHINAAALGPAASDPATRLMYWKRLQLVWGEPSTWTQHYEWNWNWAGDPIAAAGSWIRDEADKWLTIRP